MEIAQGHLSNDNVRNKFYINICIVEKDSL